MSEYGYVKASITLEDGRAFTIEPIPADHFVVVGDGGSEVIQAARLIDCALRSL